MQKRENIFAVKILFEYVNRKILCNFQKFMIHCTAENIRCIYSVPTFELFFWCYGIVSYCVLRFLVSGILTCMNCFINFERMSI